MPGRDILKTITNDSRIGTLSSNGEQLSATDSFEVRQVEFAGSDRIPILSGGLSVILCATSGKFSVCQCPRRTLFGGQSAGMSGLNVEVNWMSNANNEQSTLSSLRRLVRLLSAGIFVEFRRNLYISFAWASHGPGTVKRFSRTVLPPA